jgi:hypothetical protein
MQVPESDDGAQVTEDVENEGVEKQPEEIDYECSPVDYVHWKDFGHTYARTWEEVTAIWRRVYMGREALVERFGEELGNKIPLDTKPDNQQKKELGSDDAYQAAIFEIWDKTSGTALWISKSMPEVLDEKPDPLKLESFWPCPRPLYGTLTNDSLVPVPDYLLYQDQALSLDLIAERIDKLIQALQVKGMHDASIPELSRLFSEAGNTDLIPVKNWAAFAEKNGLKGAIDLVDLAPIVAALEAGYKALAEVKNEVYEIMGIADIIRGASDPDETLGAQKLKGQFGSLRLRAMQSEVAQYAAEILQIKAQIMCTQYQPETLIAISAADQLMPEDQAMLQPALQLLRDRPLRNFRIEVTADSLVQLDEMQEKSERMEFLKAAGGYLQNLTQLSQSPAAPQLIPLAVSMMKFGVTAFKVGKSLEGEFDATVDKIKEMVEQQQQSPKPPPQVQLEMLRQQGEMQKIQATAQVDGQKMAMEQQMEQVKQQQDLQIEQARLAMEERARQRETMADMELERFKQEMQAQQVAHQNQLEAQRAALETQQNAALEQQRMAHEAAMEQQRQAFERWREELQAAVKVEVANISSKDKMQDAATKTSTNEIAADVRQDNGQN